jgi:hypothetical protein
MSEHGIKMRVPHRNRRGTRIARRTRMVRLLGPLLVVSVVFALFASPAFAFKTRPYLTTTSSLQGQPTGVAVDQALDRVYVSDYNGGTAAFDTDGDRVAGFPVLARVGGFNSYGVAVDNSEGSFQSYIYVSEIGSVTASGAVQQFDPAGTPTTVRITAADIPPNGTPQGGGLPPVVNPGETSFNAYSIAVDSEGNIYAVTNRGEDAENRRAIEKFSPSGEFLAQLAAGMVAGGVTGIAVDDTGNIYLSSAGPSSAGPEGLYELDPSGSCVDGCNPIDDTLAGGVGIDPATGNILVSQGNRGGEAKFGRVREYDPAHNLVATFGEGTLSNGPAGVAVDDDSDHAFVVDSQPLYEATFKTYGPLVTLPDVVTEAATDVTDASATFTGMIGAANASGATCVFQYVSEAKFAATGFEGAQTAACEPPGPFSGEAMQVVHSHVDDLAGGTRYHYRLLGTNGSGSNSGADLPFETDGPRISRESVGTVTETSAALKGTVNPRGEATNYRFEYVTQQQYEASGFTGATEVPAGGEEIGAESKDVEVSQTVDGLEPGAEYRFRLVAVNAGGTARGEAKVLRPFPPQGSSLPDGRVYEQVTPVNKNGNNVLGYSNLLKAAPDGGAVTYFITSGGGGSEGGQEFPTYVASRGPSAWSVGGFLPLSTYGERLNVTAWGKDPRISFPLLWNSGTDATFYLRDNMTGEMTEIASGLEAEFGAFEADETDGAAQVLFESTAKLTPEAIEGENEGPQNLYLWDRASGAIHLVSVLPDGSTAPAGAFAGGYQWFGDVRDDGGARRANYTQDINSLSSNAGRAFFTTPGNDQIYVRKDPGSAGASTVRISASHKDNGTGPGGTDPKGPLPAAFMTATPDGRYAFFTSFEELTNDARTGSEGNDLYRYDTEEDELIDLSPQPGTANGAEVQGVLGASDDGSYVYFVANGVLADGAAQGNCKAGPREQTGAGHCNLYVWHDGQTVFIARLSGRFEGNDAQNWYPTNNQGNVKPLKPSRVTPDGRTLLFFSTESPTEVDTGGLNQVYRYRAGAGGGLDCVSCNPTGQRAKNGIQLQSFDPGFTKPRTPLIPQQTHNLSNSGDQVFFESGDALVAADRNERLDVYEWEAEGAGSCHSDSQNGGCLFLISTGDTDTASYFADASASGDDVYFFTTKSLVGQDTDELRDVYDARAGGGLASQDPPPPNPCVGEACRGPGQVAPPLTPRGSSTYVGPPNPKPQKHKKKRHHGKAKKKQGRSHGKRHNDKKGQR